MFISFVLVVISGNKGFAAVSAILLVLTGFYLEHYCFLENSVQKMYHMYDEITEKISRSQKKCSEPARVDI